MHRPLTHLLALLTLPLVLTACGGGDGSPGRLDRIDNPVEEDFAPARPEAEYAPQLTECLRLHRRNGDNRFTPCPLGQLPLLGQSHETLTTEAIMERTLVSHSWMAERFEQVLDALPADLRRLFGGVTAVVIGSEIRPSYFWLNTGAIYLDPAELWLTRNEWKTISRDPDYRSGFGQSLNYESLARYVHDGNYAWQATPASGPTEDRPLEAILPPLASLLFHELAHANDYFPPARQPLVDPQWTPAQAGQQLRPESASAALVNTYPLNSSLMMDLAEVRFQGREATESEQRLTPRAVGLTFAEDYANDDYAYVSAQNRRFFREDTAMLFEEAMMQFHFDIRREIAFTDSPEPDGAVCDDYVVRWGERGRAGHQSVRPRLALIVPILLDRPADPYLDELPEAESLETDLGWCANLGSAERGIQRAGDAPQSPPLPQQDIGRHGPGHPHPFH